MNVFVLIKQVPDTEAVLSVKDGNSINEDNIKWIISPYDEYALEEALQLKEKDAGVVVNALTLGPERTESALRSALAMGADNGIHIQCSEDLDISTRAKILAEAIKKESDFGIVFVGRQAIDDDSNQTHILVAEYLDVPVTTNITSFKYDNGKVTVEREVEGGDIETVEMDTPCVITASKALNTPRYASLMGIMKAKKIPLKKIALDELGDISLEKKTNTKKLFAPPDKAPGRILEGEPEEMVKELVKILKDEAKVL